jgi:parallel beta-helix repeat protein
MTTAIILFSLFSFLIVNIDPVDSDTVYGEVHITSDTVWNMSKSPIYIEGNVTVDYGFNLTIEPGVEVFFNGFYNLYVEGNLSAVGNESQMIKFTSNKTIPTYSDWESIQVNTTGKINIRYCNISYADNGISVSQSEKKNQIYDNLITNNWMGVRIFESANSTLGNNNVSDNYKHGIIMSYSSENFLQNNFLSNNGLLSIGNGLHLHYADNNVLHNNVVWNNRFRGIYLFWSNLNNITYNRIFANLFDGVYITQSYDNQLRNNNISLNGYNGNHPGIYLTSTSHNNRIYHNTIIDNALQAFDGTNNSNQWGDDYPNGGNCWNDYIGVDLNRSENQDFPIPDGLGDSPYFIDPDSLDRYPLMQKMRNIAPFLIALISPLNESVIKPGTIIDLDILVQDFNKVNYTVNGGPNSTISGNFDINTTGWTDGYNRLDVYVIDENNNFNSSWFSFDFDSTKPIIQLNSPMNNSIIRAGDIINLSIIDPNIKSAFYYLDINDSNILLFPYDINTTSWADGDYFIVIYADDVADNANSTMFAFVLDSSPPDISITSPKNNSYIRPGTSLEFLITDAHLDASSIFYQIDDQTPEIFSIPYKIDTTGWDDGNYTISINSQDTLGNSITNTFDLTVDSKEPWVFLEFPANNSIIGKGTFLNFSVSDENPVIFSYFLNTGAGLALSSPYRMDTTEFADGNYTIILNVSDYAGNTNRSWFNITVDSTEPAIGLVSLMNNSYIKSGDEIAFAITEPNLKYANYSVNGEEFLSFDPSLIIDTSGWPDGPYTIEVAAEDVIGNHNTAIYVINIDSTPPRVVSTTPKNDAAGVKLNSTILIRFNEEMDKYSVLDALSIVPEVNFDTDWSLDNLSLIIKPVFNLTNSTKYRVTINTTAKDIAGNNLRSDFVLTFDTGSSDKFDWFLILLPLLMAIILIAIIALVLIYRKSDESSKGKKTNVKDEIEKEVEEKKPEGESEDKFGDDELKERDPHGEELNTSKPDTEEPEKEAKPSENPKEKPLDEPAEDSKEDPKNELEDI